LVSFLNAHILPSTRDGIPNNNITKKVGKNRQGILLERYLFFKAGRKENIFVMNE
jgi:hypothetical protein